MSTPIIIPAGDPASALRSPAEYPPGELYLYEDPTRERAGDVLVMENLELSDPKPGEPPMRPRIVARFYAFSPGGDPASNVAPVMARMFITMANDGAEAYEIHTRPKYGTNMVNPDARIILPERDFGG